MHRSLLAVALVVGCSGAAPETAPAPVAYADPGPTPDLLLNVVGNAGREGNQRLVQGFFARGRTKGQHCTVDEVDGCRLRTCSESGTDGKPIFPYPIVTVTSPSIGNEVALPIGPSGYGEIVQTGDFAPDEMVRLSGAASLELAAFEFDVRVPRPVVPQSFGQCGRLDLATTLDPCVVDDDPPIVKWTGGARYVMVTLTHALEREKSLSCTFDAAPQKGQIPANALARLARNTPILVDISGATEVARGEEVSVFAWRFPTLRLRAITLK